MNDALIVTIYVVIDETMKTLGHHSHSLAALSDAEVLTVAVAASRRGSRPRASTVACMRWPLGCPCWGRRWAPASCRRKPPSVTL